jgi:ketosteroid isomerase-like protein
MATLDQLIADDAVWHTAGRDQLAGDFECKEAIFGSFARFKQATDAQQEIHAIVADDELTVALTDTTVTRGGQTLTGQQVLVFHVVDGRAAEVWSAWVDPYAFDELIGP